MSGLPPSLDLFALLLIFARVGTVLMILPGFSAGYVSVRIRLLLALSISVLLTPVLADRLPGLPATPAALALLVLCESLIGVFLGTVAAILVAALQVAGTFGAFFLSLSNALVQDPVADQQTATLAGFFGTVGLVLIFVTDLHHLMLAAIVDSYRVFLPGVLPPLGDLAETIARQAAESVALGLQMAAPFLIVTLVYHLGLGLLGRLMPQLPVFFFGLPAHIALQIWIMTLTLSGIMMVFLTRFAEGLAPFAAP
ncbi:MAG: flagellar biosynthetic protein FliR [Rhodospirillales bacterium]